MWLPGSKHNLKIVCGQTKNTIIVVYLNLPGSKHNLKIVCVQNNNNIIVVYLQWASGKQHKLKMVCGIITHKCSLCTYNWVLASVSEFCTLLMPRRRRICRIINRKKILLICNDWNHRILPKTGFRRNDWFLIQNFKNRVYFVMIFATVFGEPNPPPSSANRGPRKRIPQYTCVCVPTLWSQLEPYSVNAVRE